MDWLFGFIVVSQFFLYWVLKPAILIISPLFEAKVWLIFIFGVIFWIFSGKSKKEIFR